MTILNNAITDLKGIGDKTASLYNNLGINTIGELLRHYPVDYDRFAEPETIEEAVGKGVTSIRCRLISPILAKRGRRVTIYSCSVTDGTGSVKLAFFNAPYIRNLLKPGIFYIFRGVIKADYSMDQPRIYNVMEYERLAQTLRPKYHLTKGLTGNMVAKAMDTAIDLIKSNGGDEALNEYLPADIYSDIEGELAFTKRDKAVFDIHFPSGDDDILAARNRLVFDEFFDFIYMIKADGRFAQKQKSSYKIEPAKDVDTFINRLPYELTGAQRRAYGDILRDMTGGYRMNRLVQGDVGSGKTIISILALLLCVSNGYQGALMAPTEVLAKQHFDNIRSFTERFDLPFRPVLITGSLKAKERRQAYELTESGEANLIVGTHALIQEKVSYKDLCLVVTDEQHRFGVRQREALSGKGEDVHILVMSATPIPRTLALILYGDLSITVVNEMPASRLPIKNSLMGPEGRIKVWRFIYKEIQKGRQAYIICPMVEEGEMDDLENVLDYTDKLRETFPQEIRIEYLHGRMKPADKTRVMEQYGAGAIDILVSTTVIEVGIDVPNATVMLIENSERFGLSQLHQLRGRIGRGSYQSYCIFLAGSTKALESERLSVMKNTNDGFKIAEEDLRLRGPGDLMGIRQSGELGFALGDICRDGDVMKMAARAVDEFIGRGLTHTLPPGYMEQPIL